MAPIGSGSHYEGPLLGSGKSFGGMFENIPQWAISRAASKYKVCYEDFQNDMADLTVMQTLGWTYTDAGTAGTPTCTITKENGFLLINAGTTADTGTGLQMNAAVTAAATSPPHASVGPQTSTATLMDDRELIFATRIGYAQAAGVWAGGVGSKAIIGWCVTDTSLMTLSTGAPSVATGGGIFFSIRESGALNFVTQRTTTAVTTVVKAAGTFPDATSTTVVGNWIELGFRAVWDDASDDNANGYVDAYVNGMKVATHVNSLPMSSTETYSVTFEVDNGPATSPNIDMGVDYILTAISRPGVPRQT